MAKNINILVADDIAAMRGVLKEILYEHGYENVTEAFNGEDTLLKFHLFNNFHMVMLDINMPIKNGMQVLKEIRAENPNVFVVMVSADSSTEIIKSSLALGVNGFIVKPYTAAKIGGVIHKFEEHLLKLNPDPA